MTWKSLAYLWPFWSCLGLWLCGRLGFSRGRVLTVVVGCLPRTIRVFLALLLLPLGCKPTALVPAESRADLPSHKHNISCNLHTFKKCHLESQSTTVVAK
uniref:Putative secreted protein n=1 Tax=Ixodes ricinus TaxID=34613 RepID=A0A6B0UGP5_IXORI